FYARDAYQCLASVPFNSAVAARFIEYYNTTIQFQSTLAYLRDPPEGYQQPKVDVLEGLAQIQQNSTDGYFKNQYEFEANLQTLIYSMHDMHVDLSAGVLSAFSFASPVYLSSVSIDGKQEPQVYIWDDIVATTSDEWKPSPIISINGENVVDYLTRFAALNSQGTLEPHADWNQLFASPAQDIQAGVNVFGGGATFYPGDNLTFGFKNGTEWPLHWLAIYNNPYNTGPLETGGDFYNYFVLGLLPASYNGSADDSSCSGGSDDDDSDGSGSSSSSKPSWYEASYHAYPSDPDVVQLDLSIAGGGIVTGYFLHDISTAVLSIPSFDQFGDNIGNFSKTVTKFIDSAQKAKLEHVIIDLQQNTGGTPVLAFDTFMQFFPRTEPYAASRRRDHYLANVLGGTTTDFWSSLSPGDDLYDFYYEDLAASEWVVTDRLDAETGKNFSSWPEFYGPREHHGDLFSLPERYNLTSEIFDDEAFDDYFFDSTHSVDPTVQNPFKAENIILLTDGLCSSTCALYAEMMTTQGHVRTVVAGGRPTKGPMQAVSGSRGAIAYWADSLDYDFSLAQLVNDTANSTLPQVRDPGIFTNFAGFTLRDQVRKDDDTPLQFKYLPADCRIYYTVANVYNMSRLWRDAASAIWDDQSLCVADSTSYISAGKTVPAQGPPSIDIQVPSAELGL
ncbi:hypothetical protein NA57DRAFT_21022, partial [Rhizodiscina lignyota]